MSSDNKDDPYNILSRLDPKTGDRVAKPFLTPRANQQEKNIFIKVPAVIPVVFLPGIMGSNLKIKGKNSRAWRPPNSGLNPEELGEIISAMWTWGWRGAKERQTILNKDAVEVDDSGPISVGTSGLSRALARERGWGSVARKSYNPIMAVLQERLNRLAFATGLMTGKPETRLDQEWQDIGMRSPAEYGEKLGLPSLTREEVIKASRYSFDVWCCGYNWLQSNRDSGQDVQTYIEEKVLAYYRKKKIPAKKVIVVTHSMGGLVSRALTEIHNAPNVLGVVHGVQPATGAPAIYHHCRAGYEGVEQWILGRNAGQVTSVVGNSPGALELIPSFDYDNGRSWLFVDNGSTSIETKGDPYTSIYVTSKWYGLVPKQNEKYLNLTTSKGSSEVSSRHNLKRAVFLAKTFHLDIASKYHSRTYIHYGADSSMPSWQSIVWTGKSEPSESEGVFDDGNGQYVRVEVSARGDGIYKIPVKSLRAGDGGAGDGTVSQPSGAAPGTVNVEAHFCHGDRGKGKYNIAEGYEHQNSYNDLRAQWATLHSIVKIAKEAYWHEG